MNKLSSLAGLLSAVLFASPAVSETGTGVPAPALPVSEVPHGTGAADTQADR